MDKARALYFGANEDKDALFYGNLTFRLQVG